jgi:hypothetical protein
MTESIVTNVFGNIVATQDTSTNIVSTLVEGVVLPGTEGTIITLPATSTVLIERDKASILVTGLVGPPGPNGTSEEDNMYAKRVDFINDLLLYRGEAIVGTAESSPAWRIRQVILSVDGDVSETWASGNANFDKVWADRALLSYV